MNNSIADLDVEPSEAFFNRELSWLAFARRVLALVEDRDLPLLERIKFTGIMGMLHDEFVMKRMSGLKRKLAKRSGKLSLDGREPGDELKACRKELLDQIAALDGAVNDDLRPALREAGVPILDFAEVDADESAALREYFLRSVAPILTPLAVDAEHPFPFISDRGLNLAVVLPAIKGTKTRFVRIKVPDNRPRWVPLPDRTGFVPLEQVISANLDLMFPETPPTKVHLFRVTRGAEGDRDPDLDLKDEPGSIVRLVAGDLKARRFAGVVRLQVAPSMPKKLTSWLAKQLEVDPKDVYSTGYFLGLADLLKLEVPGREDLHLDYPDAVTHPRLRGLDANGPEAIFDEIARGDILVHHPYHSFDTSVLRFLESAARDPAVLAIKLTIYRTNRDSPIVRALAEAARQGKQVAVLVEITARFDEAPNIAWGRYLEREGVHVAYGVESLKTHVKLVLVVREERGEIRRYAHVGTGNYHTVTAKLYEDLGLLTCVPDVCADVAAVFNELTGATPTTRHRRLLVAPVTMRRRFVELIRREAEHARASRPCGIRAKMNQLQDRETILELYRAGRDGVPIVLDVRGLCCLRPGVAGMSENIRVFGVVGRYLEHSRIYRFENGGDPEFFIGSADWMKRNLTRRVETITPILDDGIKRELDAILAVYDRDNCTAWDCMPDGSYVRRSPAAGEARRGAQDVFIAGCRAEAGRLDTRDRDSGTQTATAQDPAGQGVKGCVSSVGSRRPAPRPTVP